MAINREIGKGGSTNRNSSRSADRSREDNRDIKNSVGVEDRVCR